MLIKICGLTRIYEADYLNQQQVDFAGMVLYFPKSKRNISLEQAKKIIAALDKRIKSVAVVVDPDMGQVQELEKAGFSYIQIHGKIPEQMLKEDGIPILKAFNAKDMEKLGEYTKKKRIAGYVFDAQEPGSGKTFDWSVLKDIPRDGKLFFLAGGLNPENVDRAITEVCPDGVDVSSGVEYVDKPGKDPDKIADFVKNVRNIDN